MHLAERESYDGDVQVRVHQVENRFHGESVFVIVRLDSGARVQDTEALPC